MHVLKPIGFHVDRLGKVLADPALSDVQRYEGVLMEMPNLIQLAVLLIREHGPSIGASPFAWRTPALTGEIDLALDQFEAIFLEMLGEDKALDRNELRSLSSDLSRYPLPEAQARRLDTLLDKFAATYGEPALA